MKNVSVSQVQLYTSCARKWYREYVLGIRPPRTPKIQAAMDLGSQIHGDIEAWIKEKKRPVDPSRSRFLDLASTFLKRGPEFEIALVETEFVIPTFTGGPEWLGYVDLIYPSRQPPEIWDHKTVSTFRYRKAKHELLQDLQLLTYAHAYFTGAFGTSVASQLEAGLHYIKTTGMLEADTVSNTFDRDLTEDAWDKAIIKVRKMKVLDDSKPDWKVVDGNLAACDSYGGCPHRSDCSGLKSDSFKFSFKSPSFESAGSSAGVERSKSMGRFSGGGAASSSSSSSNGSGSGSAGGSSPAASPPAAAAPSAVSPAAVAVPVSHGQILPPDAPKDEHVFPFKINDHVKWQVRGHEPIYGVVVAIDGTGFTVGVKVGDSMMSLMSKDCVLAASPEASEPAPAKPAPKSRLRQRAEEAALNGGVVSPGASGVAVGVARPDARPDLPAAVPVEKIIAAAVATRVSGYRVDELLIGCAPLRHPQGADIVLLEDWLAPICARVAEKAGVPHFGLVDFGKGRSLLVVEILNEITAGRVPKIIICDSAFGKQAEAAIEALTPHARQVYRRLG